MSRSPALVLFAHGARDPAWAEPFRRMLDRVRASRPGLRAELAFLECMEPTLPAAISRLAGEGASRITIVPLFLAQGGHLREDLPRLVAALRREFPGLALDVTAAIGDSGELTDAIADWALARHESRS
ncbi:MAG TPA: CbiX/SirB N-terminal domain-containing protein [Burkholderiales bacterium]|nr:CbiX/SirB N-terminal domain-containing protein [Burkholderiales bacterium]